MYETVKLEGTQDLVFSDRYALKDPYRNFKVGDKVVVLVEVIGDWENRAVATITKINKEKSTATVNLHDDGTDIEIPLSNIDRPLETSPSQMWDRMAKHLPIETENDVEYWQKEFRWALDGFKFSPGGRINAFVGSEVIRSYVDMPDNYDKLNLTAFNCYVIGIKPNDDVSVHGRDSRKAIMDTLENMTQTMARGGGVGINVSPLRPVRSYVQGVNGHSSGAVSWANLYSMTTGLIEQGGCLYKDSDIITNRGIMTAKELFSRLSSNEDIMAWTYRGWRPFTDKFDNGIKSLYKMRTSNGYEIILTEDHKVSTLIDGKLELIPVKEISPGDTISLLKGNLPDYIPLYLDVDVPMRSTRSAGRKETDLPSQLNEDLSYFIGYYTANGSNVYNGRSGYEDKLADGIRITVNNKYKKDIDLLANISKRLFPDIEPIVTDGSGEYKVIEWQSVFISDFLLINGLLKESSAGARVPDLVKRSGKRQVERFIAGYFAGDGCAIGQPYCSSASIELLRDIQKLMLSIGIGSRLYEQGNETHIWYILSIPGRLSQERLLDAVGGFAQRFDGFTPSIEERSWVWPFNISNTRKGLGRIINPSSGNSSISAVSKALNKIGKDDILYEMDKCLPDQVESITPYGEGQVYDFTVEDTHKFWADGFHVSNSRRGALMLMINDWHPDVVEFIFSKVRATEIEVVRDKWRDKFPNANFKAHGINNANISVCISDKFMEAVKKDLEWTFVFPDYEAVDKKTYNAEWSGDIDDWIDKGHPVKIYDTIRARDLWDCLMESAWRSAEPGVVFMERYNKESNSWYYSPIVATNPCGEQGLPEWGVCNLGHINLSRFAAGSIGNALVDWEGIARAVRAGVRFLDDVIDYTSYHHPDNEKQQKGERRVGLGTLGLGEMLVRCGIKYGPDAKQFIDELYRFIAVEAYKASIDIAEEKGAFPYFNYDKHIQSGFMKRILPELPQEYQEKLKKTGIRNTTLLTQAPTGSTGTMIGTSTGIEPYYDWTYYRSGRLGTRLIKEKIVDEYFKENPLSLPSDEPSVEDIVASLPDFFVSAKSLSPRDHISVQATVQKWVDSSISKTANAPNSFTIEQTKELYELAYDLGCKGVTIYRDGSRDLQVLSSVDKSDKEDEQKVVDKVIRPDRVFGSTERIQMPQGKLYVTVNTTEKDGVVEVIVNGGEDANEIRALCDYIGRLISVARKYNAPLEDIVKQGRKVAGGEPFWYKADFEDRGRGLKNIPSAISLVLSRHLKESVSVKVTGVSCHICGGNNMRTEEGCTNCPDCGYSKCS